MSCTPEKVCNCDGYPAFGTVPADSTMSSLTLAASEQLATILCARGGEATRSWLERAAAEAVVSQLRTLPSAYTAASRSVGRGVLELSAAEEQALASVAPEYSFAGWTEFDAARAVLLLEAAAAVPGDAFVRGAVHCYELGDAREQQSWLKGVGLLPYPHQFLTVAVDGCRTNILQVFESIACENPYPARHFPELNFNQMVLKALFMGVALTRIVGLQRRLNPHLSRMAADYAAERRAAGRPVPADLPLALHRGVPAEEQAQ